LLQERFFGVSLPLTDLGVSLPLNDLGVFLPLNDLSTCFFYLMVNARLFRVKSKGGRKNFHVDAFETEPD